MTNRGRPTKLTPEIQKRIVDAIRVGNYIETAAAYAGVSKWTLYRWLKRGRREIERVEKNPKARIRKQEEPYVNFCDAVEKALAESEARDVTLIFEAARENWQAAAWRLERKFPDRWGRKDRLSASVEHSGRIEHEVSARVRLIEKVKEMKRRQEKNASDNKE